MRETSQCEWLNMRMVWRLYTISWLIWHWTPELEPEEIPCLVLLCGDNVDPSCRAGLGIVSGSSSVHDPMSLTILPFLNPLRNTSVLEVDGVWWPSPRACHTPSQQRLGLQWQQSNVKHECLMPEGFSHGEIFNEDIHSGCWLIYGQMLKTDFIINSLEIYHLQQSI